MESNGAGKTALVMAPLWALTGNVDPRAEVWAAGGALSVACGWDGWQARAQQQQQQPPGPAPRPPFAPTHTPPVRARCAPPAASPQGTGGGRGVSLAGLVNEGAKRARVRVEGRVNGLPFAVERTANRK